MNSRERLLESAKFHDSMAKVSTAAALRKLDQLLADTYKMIDDNGWHGDYMEPIYKRLAQAGYGEK